MTLTPLQMLERSTVRVEALGNTVQRYAAVIEGLVDAISDELDTVNSDVAGRFGEALKDANAQLAATQDALDAALKPLGDLDSEEA